MKKIIFASAFESDPAEWITPLEQALPGTSIIPFDRNTPPVGADIAIAWNPPEDLLQHEPTIKAIFNLGAGVDALLRLPGLSDDTLIVRLEDAGMAVQMAEYVVYALLRVSRQFNHYETQSRQGVWQTRADIRRRDWPVGVMGLGVMGTRVAEALACFDYPVAGWSRRGKNIRGVEGFAGNEQMDAFLTRSRVLVNTLPLTPATEGILNRKQLEKMQPNAYLVNVGRGEHLVENDLLELLDRGHFMGAMLDVFGEEPLPSEHPFWSHENIIITPHMAAASLREETIEQVATKVNAYLHQQPFSGQVRRDKGY